MERKTQTIARAVWTDWTVDDLLAWPDDWDIANISLASYDDRDKLDQAGLLYDFHHDPFWATRDMDWPVPMGVYSDDGRLIAIPYAQEVPYTVKMRNFCARKEQQTAGKLSYYRRDT